MPTIHTRRHFPVGGCGWCPMPIYDLEIKASCSPNVRHIRIDNPYVWHLQLQCMQCSEKTGWITVDPLQETTRVRSGKCHVLLHCRLCGRQVSRIVQDTVVNSIVHDCIVGTSSYLQLQ